MKNLNQYYFTAYIQLAKLNITIGFVEDLKINTRAKTRWGQCTYNGITDSYTIEISDRLLADDVDDMALYNTLVHEMLHTCENCMNHGKEWQRLADIVNNAYGYSIKRTTSAAEKGMTAYVSKETYHYIIHCNSCRSSWKYKRYSSIVRSAEDDKAKCSCGCKSFFVEYL